MCSNFSQLLFDSKSFFHTLVPPDCSQEKLTVRSCACVYYSYALLFFYNTLFSLYIQSRYTYVPLSELKPSRIVNVYGVVTFFKQPFPTKGTGESPKHSNNGILLFVPLSSGWDSGEDLSSVTESSIGGWTSALINSD